MSVDQGSIYMIGTITVSGNYGTSTSHGDAFNPLALMFMGMQLMAQPGCYPAPTNSAGGGAFPVMQFTVAEVVAAGSVPTGDIFLFSPGSQVSNSVLTLMVGQTEYTAGSAYSAALLATSWSFELYIPSV